MSILIQCFCIIVFLLTHISSLQISGTPVQKSFLRLTDSQSPWCYTANTKNAYNTIESKTDQSDYEEKIKHTNNFLATQVWPSARVASQMIEKYARSEWSICELGCGPALPAITAAHKLKNMSKTQPSVESNTNTAKIVATDLDSFALEMVAAAASEQGINLSTQIFDLTGNDASLLPIADLYILSDVFESSYVARGAAFFTHIAIQAGAKVWIFTQYDRAQKEDFLQEMKLLLNDNNINWSSNFNSCRTCKNLWLYEVDECMVQYN